MVRSVTYAQKAKKALDAKGFNVYISRQNYGAKYTCSWCVKVPEHQVARAIDIMRQENIKMNGEVYDLP